MKATEFVDQFIQEACVNLHQQDSEARLQKIFVMELICAVLGNITEMGVEMEFDMTPEVKKAYWEKIKALNERAKKPL